MVYRLAIPRPNEKRVIVVNINAYNLQENLVIWRSVKGSLSSGLFQKLSDGFKVYKQYEKFGNFKSFFYLFRLGFNSIKKKI